MVLVRRLGGWRPVDSADGVGVLRRREGGLIAGIEYRFEIWHQFSGGFKGPYRAEGQVGGLSAADLASVVGQDLVLQLEDGRFLPARVGPDGSLLSHQRPTETDPWPPEPE